MDEEHALFASAWTHWLRANVRSPFRNLGPDRGRDDGSARGRADLICVVPAEPHFPMHHSRVAGGAGFTNPFALLVVSSERPVRILIVGAEFFRRRLRVARRKVSIPKSRAHRQLPP